MIELDADTLRKLQLTELELLCEVDRICKKAGIHYNIIAGTLLGAVRHAGFIPWDDDADVAMLRPEYERFRKVCRTELDKERFYFQDDRNTKGYRWGYGKLRRKNTQFLREYQEHMPYGQGVFIDIFPLDGVSDHYAVRCFQNFHCFCIRKILWSEVGKIAEKNPYKRGIYQILSRIPLSGVKRHFHRYIRHCGKRKTRWVRILLFPTPNGEFGYLREWYENSSQIVFEGKPFWGIQDYDAYLAFKFGRYMELPPEQERKVHPVTQIHLLAEDGE